MNFNEIISNLHILDWFVLRGIKIVLMLLTMGILCKVSDVFFKKLNKISSSDIEQYRKVRTVHTLLNSVVKIIVCLVGIMLILEELNINIAPILATAGVLGLAVGFGAKRLVEDVLSGLNIILSNQIRVGDTVTIDGSISGVVEKITVNTVILRDFGGTVHFVRNGNINVISNQTKDYSYYVSDLGISYNQDFDTVFTVIKSVGKEMREDEKLKNIIIDDIEILGVDKFEESTITIKTRIKTLPSHQWVVGREFNRRIKESFDKNLIEFPYPQITVHNEQ